MPGTIINYAIGVFVIIIHLALGKWISVALDMPIPGSVIGMLLLLLSLRFSLVKLRHVRRTSDLLLRNMALFFIPPGVGVMLYFDLLSDQWPAIVVSGTVSTVVVLLVVGLVEQHLARAD